MAHSRGCRSTTSPASIAMSLVRTRSEARSRHGLGGANQSHPAQVSRVLCLRTLQGGGRGREDGCRGVRSRGGLPGSQRRSFHAESRMPLDTLGIRRVLVGSVFLRCQMRDTTRSSFVRLEPLREICSRRLCDTSATTTVPRRSSGNRNGFDPDGTAKPSRDWWSLVPTQRPAKQTGAVRLGFPRVSHDGSIASCPRRVPRSPTDPDRRGPESSITTVIDPCHTRSHTSSCRALISLPWVDMHRCRR